MILRPNSHKKIIRKHLVYILLLSNVVVGSNEIASTNKCLVIAKPDRSFETPSTLSDRGKEKFESLLRENPTIESDPLVLAVMKAVCDRQKKLAFWEKYKDLHPRFGIPAVRRSVDGHIHYEDSGNRVVVDVYNINFQPLIPYDIDPFDKTTLKLIYALRRALDTPNSQENTPQNIGFRLASIVNRAYYEALQKWGFKADGEKALILELSTHR
jgi:hypothetical protein